MGQKYGVAITENFRSRDDLLFFIEEVLKIQFELLEFFPELDEEDQNKAIKELKAIEENLKTIDVFLREDDSRGEEKPQGILEPFFDFHRLSYLFEYKQIEEFCNEVITTREELWKDKFEDFKIDAANLSNEIKRYIESKKEQVVYFENKTKSVNVFYRKLITGKIKLSENEKIYLVLDTLMFLRNLSLMRITHVLEKQEKFRKVYHTFSQIHKHFLKQLLDNAGYKDIINNAPIVDEISDDKEEFFEEIERKIPNLFTSVEAKLKRKSIDIDHRLLIVDSYFGDYQNKLKRINQFSNEHLIITISTYEKIKTKFRNDINSLFIDDIRKALDKKNLDKSSKVESWDFSFVINHQFKEIILRDHQELKVNLAFDCLKSSLVLMGGILEAIFFDLFYKNDEQLKKKFEEKSPRREYLYSHNKFRYLLDTAQQLSIINEEIKQRCELLWTFRNNVHSMKELEGGLSLSKEDVEASINLMTTVIKNLGKKITSHLKIIQEGINNIDPMLTEPPN